MRVPIEDDLRRIARSIVDEKKTVDEWAEVESDDMFREGGYTGGFDADEGEFCFSYYHSGGEVWFQVSLAQIAEIARGDSPEITGRPAE